MKPGTTGPPCLLPSYGPSSLRATRRPLPMATPLIPNPGHLSAQAQVDRKRGIPVRRSSEAGSTGPYELPFVLGLPLAPQHYPVAACRIVYPRIRLPSNTPSGVNEPIRNPFPSRSWQHPLPAHPFRVTAHLAFWFAYRLILALAMTMRRFLSKGVGRAQ